MGYRSQRITVKADSQAVGTALFALDYIRGQGPARGKLRKTFGDAMKNALAAQSKSVGGMPRIGMANDSGPRPRNEDSAVAMLGHLGGASDAIPVVLAGVADGIGGGNDGDRAGAIALNTLTEDVVAELTYLDDNKADRIWNTQNIEDLLMLAVNDAHGTIKAKTDGGGTTLTCALIIDGVAHIAHIGDSRAYLINAGEGEIDRLTRDHRIVSKLQEVGILTREQAKRHPQAHILYRSLGIKDPVEVDLNHHNLEAGSLLLLCTDGISDVLSRDEIYWIVTRADDPQDACEELIHAAVDRNTRDDATAVLVEIGG